ncbi:MAG: hypothetical protein AAFW00_22195 [Bacteroidota bacterium]
MKRIVTIIKILGGVIIIPGMFLHILHWPYGKELYLTGSSLLVLGYVLWIIQFILNRKSYTPREMICEVTFELSAVTFAFALIHKIAQSPYTNGLLIAGIILGLIYFLLISTGKRAPQIYKLDMYRGDSSEKKKD